MRRKKRCSSGGPFSLHWSEKNIKAVVIKTIFALLMLIPTILNNKINIFFLLSYSTHSSSDIFDYKEISSKKKPEQEREREIHFKMKLLLLYSSIAARNKTMSSSRSISFTASSPSWPNTLMTTNYIISYHIISYHADKAQIKYFVLR